MVTQEALRAQIKEILKRDKETTQIDTYADTLETALSGSAIELRTPIANLDYEVLEQGSPGILWGIGKEPWHITVTISDRITTKAAGELETSKETAEEAVAIPDIDGVFFVRCFGSDIMLKVIPCSGNGKKIDLKHVIDSIAQYTDGISIDRTIIEKCIKEGTESTYIQVGTHTYDEAADAVFSITVTDDEMEAIIAARPPQKNGADISPKNVLAVCKAQNIITDADFTPLANFIDNPVWNEPTIIARGIPPVDGKDASMEYFFETDKSKVAVKETKGGAVDFKSLNLIQNVEAGQQVAKKSSASKGKSGTTLFGKQLSAKDGVDIPMPAGSNVAVNGEFLVAEITGRVFLQNGKVSVEQILQLDGVSVKSGNVEFLGTVVVNGNIEDGYNVKASDDIEVTGTVGKSNLEAGGNIIIASGIIGRGEERICAGKSVWAKFIQNAVVEAGEYVIVTDGIINSDVLANKKILMSGKRATIVGGRLCAADEINAKTIGSTDGRSETVLEVGYDAKKKKRLDELLELQVVNTKEVVEIDLNLQTFENIKKAQKTLPADKQVAYTKLLKKKEELELELQSSTDESKAILAEFKTSVTKGKVSASEIVYPGVKITVRDVRSDVKTEVRAVTFFYRNGTVERGKYEEVSPDDAKLLKQKY